jgi:hypothetical protein
MPSVAQQQAHNELDIFAIVAVIRAQFLLKRCRKVRKTARRQSAAGELEEGSPETDNIRTASTA